MNNLVPIDYILIKTQTPRAWLLNIHNELFWLPKKLCEINEETSTIFIPAWMAKEKGLL